MRSPNPLDDEDADDPLTRIYIGPTTSRTTTDVPSSGEDETEKQINLILLRYRKEPIMLLVTR